MIEISEEVLRMLASIVGPSSAASKALDNADARRAVGEQVRFFKVGAAIIVQGAPATAMQVGCEREDGLLNIHTESEACEVCTPATTGGGNV